MFTESITQRDQFNSPRAPSSSRTRRWSLAHTRDFDHSVKRRWAVASDGPNDADGTCCQVQPDVATNTIAASTSRSPYRRRPPPEVATAPPVPPAGIPEFAELLADTRQSAAHLEMRDAYFTNPRFEAWQGGRRVDWDDRGSWWRPYHQNIADAVARGVHVRRVRSCPSR